MALHLNDRIVRLPYEEFYGAYGSQMQRLISDVRTPLSVASIMERRLYAVQTGDWRQNDFATGDGCAIKGDLFKIVVDAQPLREMTGLSILGGSNDLILEEGIYETLNGPEFSRKDPNISLEKDLLPTEIKKHPVWQALAGGNQALLDAYVDSVEDKLKQYVHYGKAPNYERAMGIYLDKSIPIPILQPFYFHSWDGTSRVTGPLWGSSCLVGKAS